MEQEQDKGEMSFTVYAALLAEPFVKGLLLLYASFFKKTALKGGALSE